MKLNFLNTTIELTENEAADELILSIDTNAIDGQDTIRFNRKNEEATAFLDALEAFVNNARDVFHFRPLLTPDYTQQNGSNLMVPFVAEAV